MPLAAYQSPQELAVRLASGLLLLAMLASSAFNYYLDVPIVPNIVYLLDTLNFITHEIGHPLFGLLGEFMLYAGGTLFQLLVPFVCVSVAILQRSLLGVWFFVFWFGQNFVGISRYIADARAHELRLFSPAMLSRPMSQQEVREHHDWTYMLTKLGLLEFDIALSWLVFSAGVLVMLFAVAGAALKLESTIAECWRRRYPAASAQQ